MEGRDEEETRSTVNQLVLTALDLNNEVGYLLSASRRAIDVRRTQAHDTHHPIDVGDYYENQKEAALARAKAYRATRLPKFLGYFQKVLKSNPDAKTNGGTYLVGSTTTTADLVLFEVRVSLLFPPYKGT